MDAVIGDERVPPERFDRRFQDADAVPPPRPFEHQRPTAVKNMIGNDGAAIETKVVR